MEITIGPTPETVDHEGVTMRIWKGRSDKGTPIVAYVYCICQDDDKPGVLQREVPVYMTPTKVTVA